MHFINSLEFARDLDSKDKLSKYRERFHFPLFKEKHVNYFCGNSLGLQPKSVSSAIQQELEDWAKLGVEAHFHGKNPWFSYHEFLTKPLAAVIGALPVEVVAMNTLTTNLHLLMVSFYRPTQKRFKILCEEKAFSSDQYALASQIKFHGFDPEKSIIELKPRTKEYNIRTEDIVNTIRENSKELALVLLGGVNYYTGQAFEMEKITKAAHEHNITVGFDLAHAAGNLKLELHKWNVDFAVWCSYKYLNSGPGSVAGLFVHEKHAENFQLPRFSGWWGNDSDSRFLMKKEFTPSKGAEGWQLSNAPVLSMAAHKASLEIFNEIGMEALRNKSELLTAYMEFLIDDITKEDAEAVRIITPRDKNQRGCQLSLLIENHGKELFKTLSEKGMVADWREPNVIRVAPVPLYNSFEDVYTFSEILNEFLKSKFLAKTND